MMIQFKNRMDVYRYLYAKRLHILNEAQRDTLFWTEDLARDEYYLSRKANIFAVENTERVWQLAQPYTGDVLPSQFIEEITHEASR